MQSLTIFLYWLPLIYLVFINFIAFILMWWDKRKAVKQDWRVSEVTLFILGFVGGAIGILSGVFRFRHKTQKRSFQVFAILGLFVSLIIYWFIGTLYLLW